MYMQIIYIGLVTNFLVSFFLFCRQYKALKNGKIHNILKSKIKDEDFQVTKNYTKEKLIFSIILSIKGFIENYAIIYTNFIPRSYDYFAKLANLKSELVAQVSYFCIYSLLFSFLNIPFSLFATFSIEERYGFNNMTVSMFFIDLIKSNVLSIVISSILSSAVLQVIDYFDTFYIKLTVFLALFQILMIMIYPTVISPLFNKFVEMEDGALKDKIKVLVDRIGFKLSKIFIMDGSKRSGHSNAYFIGLFKEKRIVFYDTLLKQSTEDEIIAILAHELGHWYHMHLPRMMISQIFTQLIFLYLFEITLKNNNFSIAIFNTEKVPVLIKMIYFGMLLTIISPFTTLFTNMLSRRNERQADEYAVKLGFGDDLKSGLISIHKENKSNLCVDWMYSSYYYSHPTLMERIDFITEKQKLFSEKEK